MRKKNNSSLNFIMYQNINSISEKSENHPSVHKIRQTFMTDEKFSFKFVTEKIVRKKCEFRWCYGYSQWWYTRQTIDIHLPYITDIRNLSIEEAYFPDELKPAEINPIFKKKDDLNKGNYRSLSVLPHKAVTRTCSVKLQTEACNCIKIETLEQVFFCEFCDISKNTFSYRTPLDDCFC